MRYLPHLVLAFSAAALGAAYIAEYGFGLEPCPLCLYQRIPFWLTAALGLAAMATPAAVLRAAMMMAAALAFAAGAAIAFYHVGVEQHWWASAVCGNAIESGLTVEQLAERLMATPVQACDRVTWSLFGISMATYNAAYSPALAAGTMAGASALWRTRPS